MYTYSIMSTSLTGALKQGMGDLQNKGMGMMNSAMQSVGTTMTLPMVKKFRLDLEAQMKNKREFEKKPIEERQAIFNEIKAISKLLHLEGARANMARNFGFKGGMKSRRRHRKKGKKSKTVKRRRK